MDPNSFGIRGFLIDAPEYGSLRTQRNGAIIVENGRFAEIGDYDDLRKRPRALDRARGGRDFPGLIDCHTHLPQSSAVARGESQLLPWLRENIFPVEREFTGPKAREEAPLFFHELARNGDLAALLPYGKQGKRIDDLTAEDILALCIYRGGPQANLETYVRGQCVYRAPELATRV
jgi:cytosine/adenosine deaminase-related metal-dependent hydrolase